MKIEKNKVVSMHYVLRDMAGEVVDQSETDGPLSFIQGIGNIIPGLERVLEGKSIGDKFKITITPEDGGYGAIQPELIGKVPRSNFDENENLELGLVFEVNNEQGQYLARVVELDETHVTLDANHPMAGQILNFEIEVVSVRDANLTELAHGHVHPNGESDH
ncbi:MAG: hypothetical protein A2X86_04100 [Bdellovibrionales bacterium GWA2_49_15]|nr:MAG: hypothetical protein A2X86_04100 [Bdellovibrionales bacterium GWA2_49_15]HAZ12811.1 peptidylprolyl isomerase [Bdellovibrionales bacterium]